MSHGTTEPGPGRLQCDQCGRWFRPAGLHGHKRFYHAMWREQLVREVGDRYIELARERRLPRETALALMETENMSVEELLRWRRNLEARLRR